MHTYTTHKHTYTSGICTPFIHSDLLGLFSHILRLAHTESEDLGTYAVSACVPMIHQTVHFGAMEHVFCLFADVFSVVTYNCEKVCALESRMFN